jgi:hypothetical protein
MTLPPPVDPQFDPATRPAAPSSAHLSARANATPARRPRWLLILLLPVLALVAFGSYSAMVRSRNIERAIQAQRITDQIELEKIQLQSKMREGTATVEDIDRMKAVTDRAADELENTDKPTAATLRDFIALSSEASRALVGAFNEFQKEGGLDPGTLVEKTTLEARLAKLRAIKPIADHSLTKIKRLVDDTVAAGKKNGLSEADARRFVDRIGKEKPAQFTRIRELDVEMIKEMDAYLTLLNDNFNGWSFKDGQIVFESDERLAEFQAIAGRLGELANEQSKLVVKTQGQSKFLSPP